MERFFSINKWFVFFCALFVVVWIVLQRVADERLIEISKYCAKNVFTWQWRDLGWVCQADITKVSVQKRTSTDAKVKITGKQHMAGLKDEDLTATLTFYRLGKNWILGKVEFN